MSDEDVLLSNNFYLSSAGITSLSSSNHVANLQQSVGFPRSSSSSSVNAPLINQKTGLMKNSPSMRALESILSLKPDPLATTIEEEEEEESPAKSDLDDLDNFQFVQPGRFNPTRGSTISVQTFQTARSHSAESLLDSFQPNSTTTKRTSVTTIDEDFDETPILEQPHTFAKHTTTDYSPRMVQSVPLYANYMNNLSTKSLESLKGSSSPLPNSNLPQTPKEEKPQLPEKQNQFKPQADKKSSQKYSSMLPEPVSKDIPSTPEQLAPSKFASTPTTINTVNTINTVELTGTLNGTEKKPRPRSNSSFSLAFKKDGKHKRSSTISDLTQVEDLKETKQKEKKFSFRSLFKLKSKNHSLDKVSQPKKLENRSMSTPILNVQKELPEIKQRPALEKTHSSSFLNKFKKNKSSDNLKAEATAKPVEPVAEPVKAELVKAEPVKAEPVKTEPVQKSYTTASLQDAQPRSYKSNTNINFIREVSDDDYNPNHVYGNHDEEYRDSVKLQEHPPTKHGNYRFGEEMSLVPKENYLGGDNDFGSPFKVTYNGTPRIVTSPPPVFEPKQEVQLPKVDVEEKPVQEAPDKSPEKGLLGEALFPKSLNAQEVESIVSLERSMSMKSVRSNKRSSFANYDGSDDNIVQGRNLRKLQPNGMKRSASILKNSSSKKDLKDALNPPSIDVLDSSLNSIDAHLESTTNEQSFDTSLLPEIVLDDSNNFQDFIEFQDFIDVDDLDFSVSPREIDEARPEVTQIPESGTRYAEATEEVEPEVEEIEHITVDDVSYSEPVKPIVSTDSPSKRNIEDSTLLADNEASDSDSDKVPLTPSIAASPVDRDALRTSPILETALKASENSPLNESGYNAYSNRPISMSFKSRGLNGPSFGGNLRDIRNSESHQSFNISFGDSETDISSKAVGDGFGSDDEEEEEEELTDDLKENHQFFPPSKQWGNAKESASSSPRTLTSVISKITKSPQPKQKEAKGVRFSSRIILYDTYDGDEYDRHPDTAACNQLTPQLAQFIREEINLMKSEMEVHEDSRCYTYFL